MFSHPLPPRQAACIDLKASPPAERKRSAGEMLQKKDTNQQQRQVPVEEQGSAKKRICVDLSQS